MSVTTFELGPNAWLLAATTMPSLMTVVPSKDGLVPDSRKVAGANGLLWMTIDTSSPLKRPGYSASENWLMVRV